MSSVTIEAGRPGDDSEVRKARGAYFTPDALCDYLSWWAIREPGDRILEPSAGEAAFLLSAVRRLSSLGGPERGHRLDGFELHDDSARRARSLVTAAGARARITTGDFLRQPAAAEYDVVIGNPPYIRYQDFTGEARRVAVEAALAQGVRLTGLASSWAAFVVHASAFLKPTGRLGLVLPAELLAANYASDVRSYLLRRFRRVTLVLFAEQVFPGVMTEAVLLLAEGSGGAEHVELRQVRNADSLGGAVLGGSWRPPAPHAKWTAGLVSTAATEANSRLIDSGVFSVMSEWGKALLGAVTGSNDYFALSPARASELGIPAGELLELSPPGSRHLRALRLTPAALARLGREGLSTVLFRPGDRPSRAALRYIEQGEAMGVSAAYKCRTRKPWWQVPVLTPPDLFLTYMNADTPRFAANSARARHLNSVHGVYLHKSVRSLSLPLAVASLNSVTMLGAETVGRAYGGGILKLEPGESVHLPLPSVEIVRRRCDELRGLIVPMSRYLRAGELTRAAFLVDDLLLRRSGLMSDRELSEVRSALTAMALRRTTRGSTGRAGRGESIVDNG